MWILPKALSPSSESQALSCCVENVFVRGAIATPRVWLNIQNSKMWSEFVINRVHTTYEPRSTSALLCSFKGDSVKQHTQATDNVWCDLPLFNISSKNVSFCEFSLAAWSDWESQRYSDFRDRNIQGNAPKNKWATPCVRDHFDAKMTAPLPQRKDGKSRMDGIARQALDVEQYRGPLNPRWIEPLMGLQVGWVTPTFGKRKK